MVKYPIPAGRIEVLRFDNVKLGQGREANVSHVKVRFALLKDVLLHRPNRIRESCHRRRVFRAAQARTHAMPEVRNCRIREMTKDYNSEDQTPLVELEWWSRLIPNVPAICFGKGIIL